MTLRLGLRQKIFFAISSLVVFVGLAVFLFIEYGFSGHLRQELEKRGVSIARHVAHNSVNSILAQDMLALKIAAHQQKMAEEDIVYIFFLGTRPGEVLAHTFENGFPLALLEANRLEEDQGHSIRYLVTEKGPIYDVAVPVARGGLGQIRLGISATPVTLAIETLTRDILVATLLLAGLGLLLAIPLSAAIARPLRRLTDAAGAVGEGHFDQYIPEQGNDEFGRLARTFNGMTRSLRSAQNDLLERNQRLADEVARRQAAEEQLAFQLNFLTTLMNELPGPVFYHDIQGVYLGCNRAFEEFFGLERQQVIGRTPFDLFPEAEARLHYQADQGLLAEAGTCQYEGRVIRPDGGERRAIFRKTTFTDHAGDLTGLVGIVIDVTAEREIDRLRREFVSTAAHEFQTPLAAIIGFCDLLQEPAAVAPEQRQEYVGIIQERAEFLSRLVDQFLDVSRIEAGRNVPLNPGPCHPDRLIQKLMRSFQHKHGLRFEVRLPKDCPQIVADEDRLAQVIENLLSNAVKYSPAEGRIAITGKCEGELFRLSVEDHGTGLQPDQLERIFEKFYRADHSETAPSGTGLGLYIAQTIVEAHGGSIDASSIPGQGTRISFTLPTQGLPTASPPCLIR
jgi:PAS domain S-box-containing protein